MSTSRAAVILLAKELRLEFRTREILTSTVVFALVVVVLFRSPHVTSPSQPTTSLPN